MNLVSMENDRPVTTSLVVAEAFYKQHKNVLRDIEALECSVEFNRLNFEPISYKDSMNRSKPAYNITRDGFTFLAMGFTGSKAAEFKEKFIMAFNAMEAKLKQPDPMVSLNDPHVMRNLLLNYSEKVVALEQTVTEQAPKVAALDRISTADGSLCLTDAAKSLQIRPKDLTSWLSSHKWIYKRAGGKNWIGYQDKLQRLLLEHKITIVERSDGTDKTTEQVRVTPRGMAMLAGLIDPPPIINQQQIVNA